MSDQATVEKQLPEKGISWRSRWSFSWKHIRPVAYGYAAVLLTVVSIQALCLFFLWRPPQDWVSFGARVVTSPAMAGLFAVVAATIGAVQLSKQLSHTKEKAADDAWWQQFEWVTDRIIAPGQKSEADSSRLPMSLAFDLLNALARSAAATFQEAAVAGILNHYLKDFRKQQAMLPDQDETSTSNGPTTNSSNGPSMDSEGAESLRNLIDELPESSRARARTVLKAYERQYEQDVVKALDHVFGDAVHTQDPVVPGADAVIQLGSRRAIVEARQSIRETHRLQKIIPEVKDRMIRGDAEIGMIITPPAPRNPASPVFRGLARNGIHLIEWEPSMGSFALRSSVSRVFEGLNTEGAPTAGEEDALAGEAEMSKGPAAI